MLDSTPRPLGHESPPITTPPPLPWRRKRSFQCLMCDCVGGYESQCTRFFFWTISECKLPWKFQWSHRRLFMFKLDNLSAQYKVKNGGHLSCRTIDGCYNWLYGGCQPSINALLMWKKPLDLSIGLSKLGRCRSLNSNFWAGALV